MRGRYIYQELIAIAVRRRVLFLTFFHDFFIQQMALTEWRMGDSDTY